MPFNAQFDASQYQPQYTLGGHPKGKFPATITNTEVRETKDKTGGMFVIEYTTQSGKIEDRFNLWNTSPQAVQIAQKQLSAVCYVTGIFRIDFQNDGAALRGAKLMIEVDDQKNKEGQPTGYVEIIKIFDMQGNEPGKSSGGAPQGQQPSGGGWSQQPAQSSQPATQQAPSGWGGGQQQPAQQQQPPAQQQPQGQAWQPGPTQAPAATGAPANSGAPPWAR